MPATVALLISFTWLFVNLVNVAASGIVLAHRDGYQRTSFVVTSLEYRDSPRSGLFWGLRGQVEGRQERYFAPTLADGKALGEAGLKRRFPPGTVLAVWYNPEVSDTLFQGRSLHLLPDTPDLAAGEWRRLAWWAKYCLLPFLLALLFSRWWRQRFPPPASLAATAGNDQQLSLGARIAIGLVMIAAGTLPILAALQLGPLGSLTIHGPPWLALVAGGIFVLVGVVMLFGNPARSTPWSQLLLFAIMAGFAAMANWIAFGEGPRRCSGGIAGWNWSMSGLMVEFGCRGAFAIGALLLDGILALMLAQGLRRLLGEAPGLGLLEKSGIALVLLALSPLLLPLLLILLLKTLVSGLIEYRRSGRWPRNEAFIARMKQRRADKLNRR